MIELKPGDIFCTRNPMMLGRVINAVQKFHAKDNKSEYSHSGIIIDSFGTSFEALWRNRLQYFFEAYRGQKVLIGRHVDMNPAIFAVGWVGVKGHWGKRYALHRLPLFFLPFMAKHLNSGLAVCSELTMKFLCHCRLADEWRGWTPDDVADMIIKWKEYEIIFEGELK